MNLRKFLFIVGLFLLLNHLAAFAQRDSIGLPTIIDKTQRYTTGHPFEKVFLHFDKPYYALNDTIWLKAYVTTDLHVPSTLSKIVYVDFISDERVFTTELKLQLVNGVAGSYLPLLPANFKPGYYHVRAYTRWMRNFDEAYFFNRTISVGTMQSGVVLPKITFNNTITEKSAKINASVTYRDQNGLPYANKKVSWKATSDDDVLGRGRGETDASGKLIIDFVTEKPAEINTAHISTEIELEDKKLVTKAFAVETTPPGIDVQLFPEGGYLINGVRSRVAFKALKPDGFGIDAQGNITDNTGAVMADFKSQHLGMGVFALLPEAGKTYKANFKFADGTQTSIELPTPRDEGINLSLNNSNPDTLSLKIAANEPYFEKYRNKSFYVIAQSNGIICYAAQTVLRNAVYSASIPKNKFPTGLLQVTLFSVKGTPLSERLAFIRHNDLMTLSLSSDKSTYNRKTKVKMQVSAKNGLVPVEGNFSVSVVDEALVPYDQDDETTILSHLLLTSDLRGFVEKPNYYFNHTDQNAINNLDILMLTQGYRRFSYKNIISDKNTQLSFFPETGIDVSGSLRTNAGIPVSKGNIRLFIPDRAFSTQTTTDVNGNFRFSNVLISDSSKVKVTARDNPNSSNLVLKVDPLVQPPGSQFINPAGTIANIDSTLRPYLQNSVKQQNALNKPHVLNEVVIREKTAPPKVSHEDFPTMQGLSLVADHSVSGDKFAGCPVMVQCLASEAIGVTFDNNNFYLTRDFNSSSSTRTPMAIFVNGMAVDLSYLNNIDGNNIESVEIFNSDGFSGINKGTNTKGVIEVNLKKIPKGVKISKDELFNMLPKTYEAEFSPIGYTTTRIFYSPKYEDPAKAANLIDYRTTIYWSPNVITDKNGIANFEFYNADGTGSYRAIIQGIDKDGNIGWSVYHYQVQ